MPKEFHGTPVAGIAVCYNGPIADGEKAVRPIKAFGQPLADTIQPKPFAAHQAFLDSGQPSGRRYYWKSDYFREMGPEAADVLIGHAERIASPFSAVLVMHLGGAASRVDGTATAAGNRDAEYVFNVQAAWEDPAESGSISVGRAPIREGMRPFSSGGTYVNFLTADEDDDRVRTRPTVPPSTID